MVHLRDLLSKIRGRKEEFEEETISEEESLEMEEETPEEESVEEELTFEEEPSEEGILSQPVGRGEVDIEEKFEEVMIKLDHIEERLLRIEVILRKLLREQ